MFYIIVKVRLLQLKISCPWAQTAVSQHWWIRMLSPTAAWSRSSSLFTISSSIPTHPFYQLSKNANIQIWFSWFIFVRPYNNIIHFIFMMSTKYLATFLFLSLYLLRIRIMFVTTRSYIIMWRHPQLSTSSGQEKYKKNSEEKMEALEHKILSASVIVVLSLVFGYLPLILAKK